jgi:hypothetical protein
LSGVQMDRIALSAILLLLAPDVQAQTITGGSWGSVQLLSVGHNIEVHRFGTERLSGKFVSATPDALVIGRGASEVTVPRTAVREVKARRASRRLRNGAMGAGIGAGVGGGVTAIALRGDFDGDGLAAAVTVIVAMIGAGVGFGIGLAIPGYATVYKAVK